MPLWTLLLAYPVPLAALLVLAWRLERPRPAPIEAEADAALWHWAIR